MSKLEDAGYEARFRPMFDSSWRTLDDKFRVCTSIRDNGVEREPVSLRSLEGSRHLEALFFRRNPLSLEELGILPNLSSLAIVPQTRTTIARIPLHFPNLKNLVLPMDENVIKDVQRLPVSMPGIEGVAFLESGETVKLTGMRGLRSCFPNATAITIKGADLQNCSLEPLAGVHLDTLDLSKTKAALKTKTPLRVDNLFLEDNSYTSDNIAPLKDAKILSLKLGGNYLDDTSIPTLLSVVGLRSISLYHNSISLEGISKLAEHPTLEEINVEFYKYEGLEKELSKVGIKVREVIMPKRQTEGRGEAESALLKLLDALE